MPYTYPPQKHVTELNKWCLEIIHAVQKRLKEFFTFDIRLIGSGEKRLVTQKENECFDLDYNLIIQRDKKDLINDPKTIKDLFANAFNDVLNRKVNGRHKVSNSTSVLENEIIEKDQLVFKFDVAILVKADDDCYYKISVDKKQMPPRYLWNRVKDSKNYLSRFSFVKQQFPFKDFKERYLELKNLHLNNNDQVESFSVFLEALNEFEQKLRRKN